MCQSTIKCKVEPGSTLLYLPDPTVPYYQSSFQEQREFICQYDSNDEQEMGSIIAVIIVFMIQIINAIWSCDIYSWYSC